MPVLLLFLLLLTAGCQPAGDRRDDPVIQSDNRGYRLQNVVYPHDLEPNLTPYGTPVNVGTSSEYDRNIRPDAVSHYFLPDE